MNNIITYSRPGEVNDGFPAGKLGNQAGGFPFEALGHTWKGSEYLYMIGRWSTNSDEHLAIQKDVLTAVSGYAVKRYKRMKYKRFSRPDFNEWRHEWMTWVVWQKCIGNADFRKLLLATGDATIIEVVKRDPVWAAWPDGNGNYVGANGMGKILMACRAALRANTTPNIDTNKLNEAGIWILGQKVQF
jgi:ribA/ribD-fused uncharacterized protein